jgi:hypothetical protein
MDDRWKRYLRAWVSFWPKPKQYAEGGYSNCEIYIGQVVEVEPQAPSEKGKIPRATLTVRGITKKEMKIDSLESHAMRHASYEEAYERREEYGRKRK